jgi:SSS family solute:Na+ symporter
MPFDSPRLSLLDGVIVAGSLLLAMAVGMVAARRAEQTPEGYFLASGKMPWWMIGAAFVSTSVSSEQIVGTMGAVYKGGMVIANWEWWCLPTYLLTILFFVPLYLRNRITTVPEFLNRRFGPACGSIYSGVILFGYVFVFLPSVLYGGSVTVSQLMGWPQWAVLIGIAALTGLYTVAGGLTAVMWTDAVQCLMLVGGGILLFFVALSRVPGGWAAMVAAAPERFHLYRPPADPEAPFLGLIVASFGVFLFYQSTNQVMIQRVLSARSTWDGVMGIIFAGFINLARPLVTCLLGLIVYHWTQVLHRAPSLLPDRQDEAFALALSAFAPSGLRGVVLAGFFAAVMSTVSALSNSVATIYSLDVHRRLWRRPVSDQELLTAGRLASAAALLFACLTTSLVAHVGIFKYFQMGVTYMATPFISVILLGIFWRRVGYSAALVGLLGGVVIQIFLAVALPAAGKNLHWLYTGAIAQILTMALTALAALSSNPAPRAQSEPFHWRPSVVAHIQDTRVRPWWQRTKLWFALYAVLWIGIYVWFW